MPTGLMRKMGSSGSLNLTDREASVTVSDRAGDRRHRGRGLGRAIGAVRVSVAQPSSQREKLADMGPGEDGAHLAVMQHQRQAKAASATVENLLGTLVPSKSRRTGCSAGVGLGSWA